MARFPPSVTRSRRRSVKIVRAQAKPQPKVAPAPAPKAAAPAPAPAPAPAAKAVAPAAAPGLTMENTKAELTTAAEKAGLTLRAGATKAEILAALEG